MCPTVWEYKTSLILDDQKQRYKDRESGINSFDVKPSKL